MFRAEVAAEFAEERQRRWGVLAAVSLPVRYATPTGKCPVSLRTSWTPGFWFLPSQAVYSLSLSNL